MRFNKAELATLASNSQIKFDKEGLLIITERQEGFFRRADVNNPRWCKLRGNLLFYLKDDCVLSPPAGIIVLDNCRPVIRNNEREFDGFVFFLEFEGNLSQRIAARSSQDRLDWVKCIQLTSNTYISHQIQYLREQVDIATMGNRIERGLPTYAACNEATLLNAVLPTATVTATAAAAATASTSARRAGIEQEPSCSTKVEEGDLIQF